MGIFDDIKSSWTAVFSSGFIPAWKKPALYFFDLRKVARSSACYKVSVALPGSLLASTNLLQCDVDER
jgi:hypothetical protein